MNIENQPGMNEDMMRVFEHLPDYYLILSPYLKIVTASRAYRSLVDKSLHEMQGKYLFEVFPKHPDWDENADGGIFASLKKVIATRLPDELPTTRFDAPGTDGKLYERHWQTSHTPVLDDNGEIIYIIHKTTDITDTVIAERQLMESVENQRKASASSRRLSEQLERLFHEIPAQIAIVAGADFVYEYINPQYKSELFPNRDILGLPLKVALPEVEGAPIWHILCQVYTTGETYRQNEMCIPLADRMGEPQRDHYFNLVYQPLKDDTGNITGVLSFKYEITELVQARKSLEESERELSQLNEELAQANEEILASNEELASSYNQLALSNEQLQATHTSLLDMARDLELRVKERTTELLWAQKETEAQRDRLRRLFMQAPTGICILDGPDLVYELVNPPYQKFVPGREFLGKPIFEALPELRGQPVEKVLHDVYHTGKTYEGNELNVPLVNEDGVLEDRYFNFIYQARHDTAGKVDGIMVFAFDVTEMVNNRKKEQALENRFRFMLNAIPQQVWTAGPDGKLNYVNDVVCRDFGATPDEITGRGWHGFIHHDDISVSFKKWVYSLQTGSEYTAEFRVKFADGSYRWHLARALPLIEDGEIKLWLGTNTDIEIQKSNEQKKDEFLSIASHELKTPLTSIKAFNQLMARVKDQQKIESYVLKSEQHITRLEKLINDLLDVTRINAGKMLYDLQQFSFNQMIAEAVESAQMTAPEHQIILEENVVLDYNGDRPRLEQVVNNFLSNAVKYSPGGEKIIVKSIVANDELVVSIRDFGIGIEQQHLNKLFERYYRIDNTAMRFQGLGLGLFISAEILRRHNGSFWIESEPEVGSTFYFKLPVDGK